MASKGQKKRNKKKNQKRKGPAPATPLSGREALRAAVFGREGGGADGEGAGGAGKAFGPLPPPGPGPTNAGHHFYVGKGYGRDLPDHPFLRMLGRTESRLSKKVPIHGIPYGDYFDPPGATNQFELATTYPGLLIGAGYLHPVPQKAGDDGESDFQQGFFFDWTTGAPVIPGSTVKGVLRSVFPRRGDGAEIRAEKARYVSQALGGAAGAEVADPEAFAAALEPLLFEGGRMAFFDAYVMGVPADGCVFKEDFITPHRHGAFQDPVPLRLLKIGPGVRFRFPFRLAEIEVGGTAFKGGHLKSFFQTVLLDFGVGAKRNVGYGGLVVPDNG